MTNMEEMDRRDFLKTTAGVAAGSGLAGCLGGENGQSLSEEGSRVLEPGEGNFTIENGEDVDVWIDGEKYNMSITRIETDQNRDFAYLKTGGEEMEVFEPGTLYIGESKYGIEIREDSVEFQYTGEQ
ncbi:MAG: twin-arginine translocation signal domain-containing protein [Candidatus Nanohalobium sp.]